LTGKNTNIKLTLFSRVFNFFTSWIDARLSESAFKSLAAHCAVLRMSGVN